MQQRDLVAADVLPVASEAAAALAADIEARTAVCAVIGLGFVGTTVMQALIRAGFEVHGYDRSPQAVARFRSHTEAFTTAAGPSWLVGTDAAVLARADVVLVAVRVLPEPDGHVNTEPLMEAAKVLRCHPRPQRLILLESTLSPGTTRVFARDWLGEAAQTSTFVAHCPERLQEGNSNWTIANIPRLVGGLSPQAGELAGQFYQTICDEVVTVSSPEVSELSKLLENVYMAVGIGLVGEVTRLAHALGVSAQEVTAAAATKPFGYHAFHPGPGIGGHCIPNDLLILQRAGRGLGLPGTFLTETMNTSNDLPVIVVDYLEGLMASRGWHLDQTRVLLVGMGFKIGSADTTATPACDVVRRLRQRGAVPVFLDSRIDAFDVDDQAVASIPAQDLHAGAFCAGIVLTGDATVAGDTLQSAVSVLLDTGGGRIHPGGLPGAYRL